jgi:hypothetical protein
MKTQKLTRTLKDKPFYDCPYDIIFKGHRTIYATIDMSFVAQLEKARERDRARHTVEWLEYHLSLAQQTLNRIQTEACRD